MCGITGIVAKSGNIAPMLLKSLKLLEYRGYDSAGMATISKGKLYVLKDSGKIDEIEAKHKLSKLPGSIGIAHTRWATHGAPDAINAHPHIDCEAKIAVVHNGIIENFLDLKNELISKGHTFKSRTDTEVVPHLIEDFIKRGLGFRKAIIEAVKMLRGSYALAIISVYEPDIIACVKKDSPLVLGVGNGFIMCSSDMNSILPFTNKMIVLDDYEIAFIKYDAYEILRLPKLTIKDKKPITVSLKLEDAAKGGFPHFMLKEIFEQPLTIKYALETQETYLNLMAEFLDRSKEVFFVAAGTSYHAALLGSYIFSKLARLNVIPVIASEFIPRYGDSIGVDSTVVAISQSGETADVLKAVEYAKARAATILAITNMLGSTLTRVSRAYIHQQSGPEIGVAATKTFTGQLAVLYKLAIIAAKRRGKLSQRELDDLREDLARVPDKAKEVLNNTNEKMRLLAKKYRGSKFFIYLGRGISYPIAEEGRLKLLEVSYIPALAYPAGESKHGPISLIEEGIPTIFIAPPDETRDLIIGNIEEMKSRGARVITLGEYNDKELKELSDDFIEMPSINPILSPILYVIPLQLFAYYMAVELGRDPDKPRNLAKSVTVL